MEEKPTLETSHLAPYLPFKLMGICVYHGNSDPAMLQSVDVVEMYITFDQKGYSFETSLDGYKPILRPMSDLLKLITINEKSISPLLELLLVYEDIKEKPLIYKSSIRESDTGFSCEFNVNDYPCKFVLDGYLGISLFHTLTGTTVQVGNTYQLWQKLFEMHFDVFGLIKKGLAIDINTLQTNEQTT